MQNRIDLISSKFSDGELSCGNSAHRLHDWLPSPWLLVVFASGGAGGAGGGISGNWPHAKLSYLCCVGQQLKRKNKHDHDGAKKAAVENLVLIPIVLTVKLKKRKEG